MKTKKLKKSGRGTFKPRARIMRTIGDELISSESVALTELVKNAYDADATRVLIRFNPPLGEGEGSIEVVDNGHGMSLNTIIKTWLEPATNYRKREKLSKDFKRRVLGEKGIGRFAAARLADELVIITRQQDMDHEVVVSFDWKQFDDDEKYLSQVKARWEENVPKEISEGGLIEMLKKESGESAIEHYHGTILRLQKLRTDWSDGAKFKEIRANLSRLISPVWYREFAPSEKSFQIFLSTPAPLENYSGLVEPSEAFKRPHYFIKGNVDDSGNYQLEFKLKDGSTKTPSGKFTINAMTEPICGPFHVEFSIWDRDDLGDLVKETGSTLKNIRDDLNEVAGINIYRDGFRVLPYGNKKNDWLRLDLRRVQNPTLRLSNNQIVGYVFISSENNSSLRDQSNREGIVESKAFEDLQGLIISILGSFEPERYKLRHQDEKSSSVKRGGIFVGFDFKEVVEIIRTKYPNDNDLLGLVEEKSKDLDARVADAQDVISRYRRLSTLGQLIDTILHDGRTPISKISTEAILAKRRLSNAPEGDVASWLDSVLHSFELIENQSAVLSRVFQKIEPFGGRKRGKPVVMEIEKAIADAFAVLESEIAQLGVKIQLPETQTKMLIEPSEIQQVIINLLQNSLYWLETVSESSREITVLLKHGISGAVEILFSDNGPGVDPEFRDLIFHPYFSLKPDGVGLGLVIAGEIISEFYNGELQLVENGPLGGANFRIILNERG